MKKWIGIMMILVCLLSGCGMNPSGTAETILKVVTSRTDADETFKGVEERFVEQYPNVDIVWESAPDYDTYIMTRMHTKDYGDVVFVPFSMSGNPSDYEAYFASLGTVPELSKLYLDVKEADYEGEVYGLPVAVNMLGIVYNEKVFHEAGVEKLPETMEELIAISRQIKENTHAIPFYTDYNRSVGVWGGALTSFGGEQYRSQILEKGTAFQEGQPIREIMDFFYTMASEKLIEPDPVTGDFATGIQLLASGEVAMLMTGSDDLGIIQDMVKDDALIKMMPFPVQYEGKTSIAFGAPGVIGINKHTNQLELAKAFVTFFISNASGYPQSIGGISPTKKELTPEQKEVFEKHNVVLTVPDETVEVDKRYTQIATEVGVARLKDVMQQVINRGLYKEQYNSYEAFIEELEGKWEAAAK